ncbi:MAG TPA: glycogen debranching N-terminal domain-containing protein [Candidatus Limnocylindrales bacterium]|nr:glycogen debranching N-terminal domain-containing protein [Candidatus Limnocylindrales bacterium]
MTDPRSSLPPGVEDRPPIPADLPPPTDPPPPDDLPTAADIRFLPPVERPITRATDLGSVQVLKHANVYLLTDAFGDIHPDSRGLGLYDGDTRILSCSVLHVGGERPVLLQGSVGGNYRGGIVMTNPSADRNPNAKVHPMVELVGRTIGITRERLIGADGLLERVRIVNHAEAGVSVEVALDLGADGADIFEVRGYPREHRGRQLPVAVTDRRVTFRHDGLDGTQRATHLALTWPATVGTSADLVDGAAVRLRWTLALGPGAVQDVSWTIWSSERPTPDARHEVATARTDVAALFPPTPRVAVDEGAAAYHAWERGTTTVDSDHELFNLVVRRSVSDLRLLMNDGPGEGERYVAAGVPWFSTLFGRDSIITALQSLAVRPSLAVEMLTVLAAYQATEDDPTRDAEPGKILHELRTGEMARAGELPHTPYYGSVDATPLWLILLGATFDWTGDRALVDRLWPNALAALGWIDRYGDRDGDGFVEYERRSDRGLVNQGWKDSSDAIRDRNGRDVPTPIALAEVQGYVFDAKRRLASLARMRGDDALATRLEAEAEALRVRFEAAFWVEDQRYYAMALGGDKRPADAIGSNAGQCLWSGIVGADRARDVADQLFTPGLYSGWGIRTYAADQPGYNPIGYHTGTVWPHDTSLIAAGLKRYGFDDASNRLVGQVLEAAQRFPDYRLPELFCGFDRGEATTPVPYPVACSPQAWAAGAPFLFLSTMLGLHAHADRGELELTHPHLPDWLGKVTLTDLRVGSASVDLLFHRWRGTTSAEVLRKVGDVAVTIRL